jgi:hypothetical protein
MQSWTIIQRFPEHVQNTPQAIGAYRYVQWRPGIEDLHAAMQSTGSMQGNGPDMSFIQVLVNLEQIRITAVVGG